MPRYRLIADHGSPAEEFDAEDSASAEARGREMSVGTPTAKATGYRIELLEDAGWRTVTAWMPRRVRWYPGPGDVLVRPST